jgi:diguanylate cyclase (GGDEF)-like protein
MIKRVVLVAGAVNVLWLGIYLWFGSPILVAFGVGSVAAYAVSWWALQRRHNRLAVGLIWAEVVSHAALGSLLLGWHSGFHYFLMLFIPALVAGTPRRQALPLTGILLVAYGALYGACARLGPLQPLSEVQTTLVMGMNVVVVFGMLYAVAASYRTRVIEAERQLLKMATIDPLTGLANRSQFHLRAAAEVAQSAQTQAPLALVLADVDFFKRINDEYGHDTGDRVLVRLAELMRDGLRDCDVLARWGGEEFLALLPACDVQGARDIAERIRQAVAAVHVEVDGRVLNVTMSFGIAQLDADRDLQAATMRADRALYQSKREGRNRVTTDADMRSSAGVAARSAGGDGVSKPARPSSDVQTLAVT